MTDVPHKGRMQGRDLYRLYELAALLEQPVASWTTPYQRAENAMRIAGEAMELKDPDVARYAIQVNLRYVRLLIEQLAREQIADFARETERLQASIGPIMELGSMDFGGPEVRVTVSMGPHTPAPLEPGDLGVLRDGPSGTEMGGDQLIDVSLLKGFAPWPSEPKLSDVIHFGPAP